ncbi:MAG: hypothetical protein VYC10_06775 [Pseudomonadota bacterium]|nr:hypothetical protein [Pseudomonadota bacterium]
MALFQAAGVQGPSEMCQSKPEKGSPDKGDGQELRPGGGEARATIKDRLGQHDVPD